MRVTVGKPLGARLRVEATHLGTTARVWLNDEEISDFCESVEIEWHAGGPSRARLGIFVDHVDIDADTLLALQAQVKP